MKKRKKIFAFLLLLFLSECGYEAKYSIKNRENYSFSISKLNLSGDRQINLRIKQKLNVYRSFEEEKDFVLRISTKSEKITITKDSAGDATSFENIITFTVEASMGSQLKDSFKITENFIYNNNSDTFELRAYENRIKNNLTDAAMDRVIFRLADVK